MFAENSSKIFAILRIQGSRVYWGEFIEKSFDSILSLIDYVA